MDEIWVEGSHGGISSHNGLYQKPEACGKRLKSWSYKSFGNIQRRINTLHDHISSIKSFPGCHINREILRSLDSQLDHLLALMIHIGSRELERTG